MDGALGLEKEGLGGSATQELTSNFSVVTHGLGALLLGRRRLPECQFGGGVMSGPSLC